ncbi:DUF397 domain-containing protein [Streptomyces sp. NPDC046203]|uniref:DUF397 domain-containing protein n=1 Tax=Streptomyces sp. NPDC046203 TaxID=3154602 RepID=UPI0033CA6D7C
MECGYRWIRDPPNGAAGGGSCVGVAVHPVTVHVRDSKNLTGPQLAVTPEAWSTFVNEATTG